MKYKRILFLTDNFPPEVNAPATRTFEHALEWHKKGYDITIITSYPNYPKGILFDGYKQKIFSQDLNFPFRVIRIWTIMYPNEGFIKRVIDQFSYSIVAFFVGLFVKTDIIVATSPQFFTAIAGRWLGVFKNKPWIMEVRDLWPETIVAVGALKKGVLLTLLEWLEFRLYNSAYKIIVVTEAFKEKIISRGINSKKIFVHTNGVILDKFYPGPKDSELLATMPELKGKIVFAYIGTHGMTHGLDFILKSIKFLESSNPEMHFLFIGDGAEKNSLLELARKLSLKNISFHPLVPKDKVARYLSLMDVALVNLKKNDTFKTVIPSKIFEAAALHKPILLGLKGEAEEIINKYNAGICFEPENKEEFITKCRLITNEENYHKYRKGCEKLAKSFDRKQIALQVLKTITA